MKSCNSTACTDRFATTPPVPQRRYWCSAGQPRTQHSGSACKVKVKTEQLLLLFAFCNFTTLKPVAVVFHSLNFCGLTFCFFGPSCLFFFSARRTSAWCFLLILHIIIISFITVLPAFDLYLNSASLATHLLTCGVITPNCTYIHVAVLVCGILYIRLLPKLGEVSPVFCHITASSIHWPLKVLEYWRFRQQERSDSHLLIF